MVRRLLLVLLGLGAAAVAAVLWSGSAYASTPHGLAVPPVRVPAPAHAPLPLPQSPANAPHAPVATPAPAAALPHAPVAVPPVVNHAVAVVAPVVDRTVQTVQTVVPVRLPIVSTPAPVHALTHPHAARHALHAQPAASRWTHSFATTGTPHSFVASRAASSTHERVKAPTEPRHRAPLGDLGDSSDRAPQTANGMAFAVTRALPHPAGTRGSRPVSESLRQPGMVVLRDIARPG